MAGIMATLVLCWALVVPCAGLHPAEAGTGAKAPGGLDRVQAVEQGIGPAYVLKNVNDSQPPASIQERMEHWRVPGVGVAVVNNGEVDWAKGYGVIKAGGREVDEQSIFQTQSIGKVLTAVTVLALVDRGVLDLDRDVGEYLTSWELPGREMAEGEKVTLARILSHTAGLTVWGFLGYEPGQPLPTLKQMLDGTHPCNSGSVTIAWKPGERWQYSSGGYLVAQQVIEDVTGRAFPDVVEELVLKPLGMTRTFYRAQLDEELLDNAAMAHVGDGSMMDGGYRAMPEFAAGGGLWSTPSDLARLACSIGRALAGSEDEPLSTASARRMLTRGLVDFGLGVIVWGEGEALAFAHGGDNQGVHSYMVLLPELGRGAAIMSNGHQGTELVAEILRAIADVYQWPHFRTVHGSVVELDAPRLEELTGEYDVVAVRRLPLTAKDGALHVPDILGGGDDIRLYPVDSNTLVALDHTWIFAFDAGAPDGVVRGEVTFGPYRLPAEKVE